MHQAEALPTGSRADIVGGLLSPSFLADHWQDSGRIPIEYFDAPTREPEPDRVYRTVETFAPYSGVCSTDVRYTDVALPRVTIIDGPFYGAPA